MHPMDRHLLLMDTTPSFSSPVSPTYLLNLLLLSDRQYLTGGSGVAFTNPLFVDLIQYVHLVVTMGQGN